MVNPDTLIIVNMALFGLISVLHASVGNWISSSILLTAIAILYHASVVGPKKLSSNSTRFFIGKKIRRKRLK